jgi:hypothetical protein
MVTRELINRDVVFDTGTHKPPPKPFIEIT